MPAVKRSSKKHSRHMKTKKMSKKSSKNRHKGSKRRSLKTKGRKTSHHNLGRKRRSTKHKGGNPPGDANDRNIPPTMPLPIPPQRKSPVQAARDQAEKNNQKEIERTLTDVRQV